MNKTIEQNEMFQKFMNQEIIVKTNLEVLQWLEDNTDLVWIGGRAKPSTKLNFAHVSYSKSETGLRSNSTKPNTINITAEEFLEGVRELSIYEKVLKILDLKIGDKIEIEDYTGNPCTVSEQGLINSYDCEIPYHLGAIVCGLETFIKLPKPPKTHFIIIDDEKVEIPEKLFNNLKEILFEDWKIIRAE